MYVKSVDMHWMFSVRDADQRGLIQMAMTICKTGNFVVGFGPKLER